MTSKSIFKTHFSVILPSMLRSSIYLPPSGNRNTTLHSSVSFPMLATCLSHPSYLETKISLSSRGLSKLHLSLVSELHEVSVEAIIRLYFHHLKIVTYSDIGFLVCDAVLSRGHIPAKLCGATSYKHVARTVTVERSQSPIFLNSFYCHRNFLGSQI